jgi:hypothetical protein
MQLFTVDSKLARRHLDSPLLSGEDVARLLKHRSISDGTPVYLDDDTMMPVEPLCSWGRQMSYAELDKTTLTDYGRILARFAAHQAERGRDVLSATESDLVAYRRLRTQSQGRPIGTSAAAAARAEAKIALERTILATWLLMGQTIVRSEPVTAPRAARRRIAHTDPTLDAAVRYIDLRRARTEPSDNPEENQPGTRAYRHRWIVRGTGEISGTHQETTTVLFGSIRMSPAPRANHCWAASGSTSCAVSRNPPGSWFRGRCSDDTTPAHPVRASSSAGGGTSTSRPQRRSSTTAQDRSP